MYPLLKNGETIFCVKPFFKLFSKEDIVVFNHEKEGMMIKKVTRIDEKGFYVEGTTPYSIDSSIFGYLQKEDILYKMIFKF